MPQTGAVNSPSRLARLRAALLAQPGADGVGTIILQLVLITLWHPVVFALARAAADDIIIPASMFWRDIGLTSSSITRIGIPSLSLPAGVEEWCALLGGLALLATVEGCFVYLPIWFATRPTQLSLSHFVRLWWRTWLWGTVLMPAGAVLIGLVPQPANDTGIVAASFYLAGLLLYFVVVPVWFARREKRRVPRLSRWRPVCPECGYSLRRAVADRCPECGQPFPTSSRVYRRWAWRRLIWDRSDRGSLLFAYIKTMLMIIFRPTRAGRGLLLPDHYSRAARWAVVHAGLLALVGLALGSELYFTQFTVNTIKGAQDVWWQFERPPPTAGTVAVWATQSVVAWLVAIGGLPLLGILLGASIPGRHPAAKRGIAKWSLYVVPVPLFVLAAIVVANSWHGPRFRGIGWWPMLLRHPLPAPALLLWAAIAYAIWWAFGVATNPYLRHRGVGAFVVHAALYILAWLLVTDVFFNPDGLRGLL